MRRILETISYLESFQISFARHFQKTLRVLRELCGSIRTRGFTVVAGRGGCYILQPFSAQG